MPKLDTSAAPSTLSNVYEAAKQSAIEYRQFSLPHKLSASQFKVHRLKEYGEEYNLNREAISEYWNAGFEAGLNEDIKAPDNPLNYKAERLNIAVFEKHSSAMGRAGRALESAYQASYAIECIAQILNADDCERDQGDDGQPLSLYLRGGLSAAIRQMASTLHSALCHEADGLERMIKGDDAIGGNHVA